MADTGQGVSLFAGVLGWLLGPCPRVWAALRERRMGAETGPLSRAPGL